ncbi:unnamed protein product, partial [Mesorhabditis belari]|uniref:SH3 domain-containing protein n=1 Tax=Mesorhabditis belari TaxID=2138241 RepID=A0AAF3F4H0_9BILA
MHSLFREQLQSFLYAYKEPMKERGVPLIFDASKEHQYRKEFFKEDAWEKLEIAKKMKVGFAVKTNTDYDGALDRESPCREKTISFKKNQFLHIHARYSVDWWIGRHVEKKAKMGFIPTAKRIGKLEKCLDEEGTRLGQSSIWECSPPFTVVPSTRPIIFVGPAFHGSQITQLMHTALRSELTKRMGERVRKFKSDIGRKWMGRIDYEESERELKTITALCEDLSIILLEAPHVNTPLDLTGIHLAPIFVQIRVSNRSILMRLMNKTGIQNKKTELCGVDLLNSLPRDLFDVIIEEKGLPEATKRMCSFLEDYWTATHPTYEDI